MSRPVTIWIGGEPVPQMRPRLGQGRTYSPTSSWKLLVRDCVRLTKETAIPRSTPVRVRLEFRIPRPAKHYSRAKAAIRRLLPGAPPWPIGTNVGDIDNLEKAVLDAANGILWVDDAQIVSLTSTKDYADDGRPGCLITYEALT